KGWAVADGVFGSDVTSALRTELASLAPSMQHNSTVLVHPASGTSLLPKLAINEAELRDPATCAAAPLCSALQEDATLRVMLSLFLPGLRLESQAIKAQHNTGGCFPIHTDSDFGVDGRCITAIAYLNPGWQPWQGGELRLYPWPSEAVDIAPLNDRLVLFSSKTMLHRVLPSRAADRYCFTMWLSEGRSQARPPTPLQPEVGTSEEAWRRLVHPSLRKHAARWWLRDEWAASLEQAHPPSPARDALLEGFWGELGIIERVVKPLVDRAQPPGPPVTEWL
ncbi:hypothetical protein APUTEX25_002413, partial [Auxenochlorella protothecoides]